MPAATMRIPPAAQLAIIGAGTLVVPLDTMVNVAFPHIVAAFGIAVPTIQWVVICYVLVHASLMLVCGRLGDLFGYRRVFLIGCAWSAVAFVLCATAQTYAWLLAARGMQGVGAALVLSVGPALATGAFAEVQRARVLGLYTMMFAIGSAAGPVLAGALIGEWGWSAVYAIRVPVALVAFALAWLLPRGEVVARHAGFDVIGGILLFAAMASGLLALDQLQLGGGPVALLLYASAAVVAAATFVRQQRRAVSPLIALRYFRDVRLVRALVTATGLNFAGFSILLLGPFLLVRVAALSPIESGALLAASPLGMMIMAPLSARIAARIGMNQLTRLGLAVTATGLAMLGFGAAGVPVMAVGMFVQGVGQGLFQVANFDIVTSALPPRDRGVAGSLAMLTRTVGIVFGATLLMLLMRMLADMATGPGVSDAAAMVAGIQGTYRIAALVPLALLLFGWWAERRTP